MNKDQGKQYLSDYVRKTLKPSKNHLFQCPFCHSGSGDSPDSDGAFSLNPHTNHSTWKCFSCDQSGDIFDLVAHMEGISLKESFAYVANYYGLEDTPPSSKIPLSATEDPHEKAPLKQPLTPSQSKESTGAYLKEKARNLWDVQGDGLQYLLERGLTPESIHKFQLGEEQGFITIPYNPEGTYYCKRNIDDSASLKHLKAKREEVGEEPLFYEHTLYRQGKDPVFVVESPFCAMSIIQDGGDALALTGTGSRRLLHLLQKKAIQKPLILALDNDEAGQKASTQLASQLEQMGQEFQVVNLSGDCKDPNEKLQRDPLGFRQGIQETIKQRQVSRTLVYQKEYATDSFLPQLKQDIFRKTKREHLSTGFPSLDHLLDGGLHEGLYVLGAISSLGKTTFSLQVADTLCKQKTDVLFFSLEMARTELMAKSISRETLEDVIKLENHLEYAKSTREILMGQQWENYSPPQAQWLENAIGRYGHYAHRLYIFEGMGNIGIPEIQQTVAQHIELTGKKPVVMLDYLQILAPYQERYSEKQNTDKATLELKRLSRDFHIPVWVISSFNRENYSAPVNTTSFKESGAIEYSSDVLIALQYEGMEYKKGEKEGERTQRIRQERESREENLKKGNPSTVELKVLKNRNGLRGKTSFEYYPRYNFYQEMEE